MLTPREYEEAHKADEDEIDIGPVLPADIRLLIKCAVSQLRRYADDLVKAGEDIDKLNVEFLLDQIKDQLGV